MTVKNPKSKGSSFERDCCKKLSLWLSNGQKEDILWRSAMSGGRSTVALTKGKNLSNQAGDITAISEEGHYLTDIFLIECKFYNNLELWKLFYNSKGTIAKFWLKLLKDCKTYNKLPMLIAKQNKQEALVVFDWRTHDSMLIDEVYYNHIVLNVNNLDNDMFVAKFSDFLKTTDKNHLKERWIFDSVMNKTYE